MVKYTAKVLIPFILVGVDALLFFPLIGVSILEIIFFVFMAENNFVKVLRGCKKYLV